MASLLPVRSISSIVVALIFLAFTMIGGREAESAEPARSPQQWLKWFSDNWDESAWETPKSSRRPPFMRPVENRDWHARMLVLQGLTQHGRSAVPTLVSALKADDVSQRILAAQALGYLSPHVPAEPLLDAARNDKDPAVRLYAIDSLGMQGRFSEQVDWAALIKSETNKDVRMHIEYARERGSNAFDEREAERLRNWDSAKMDSAKLGGPAPEFELTAADGRKISLSDYRGRQAVVLVFIYGDT